MIESRLAVLIQSPFLKSVTNVESTRKDLTFSSTFAFRSGENAAKTSGKCGPRLAPSS